MFCWGVKLTGWWGGTMNLGEEDSMKLKLAAWSWWTKGEVGLMWRSKFSNLLRSLCLQVKRRCAKRRSTYASRRRGWGPLYYLHSVICSYHEWPITARLTMESGPNDSDLSPFDSWPVRHKGNLTSLSICYVPLSASRGHFSRKEGEPMVSCTLRSDIAM